MPCAAEVLLGFALMRLYSVLANVFNPVQMKEFVVLGFDTWR